MVKETLMEIGGSVSRHVERHAPEIGLGIGIVSMVAATIFACKGTIKAKKVVEDTKDDLNIIKETEETGETFDDDNNPVEYTHEDSIKDKIIVCTRAGIEIAKAYGPAVILTAVGIFSLIKGHNILKKRNLALAAAYSSISEAYKRYQDKVKDLIGETAAKNLKVGLKEEEIEVDTGKKNKDGTPKTKKEKKLVYDPNSNFSPYSRIYDAGCTSWENDASLNYTTLLGRQKYWNKILQTRDDHTVFLNEVYKDLGFPMTAAGQVVGWSLNHAEGDKYIDFGFTNIAYEPNRDFINGYEPCCLLDFNVDDKPVIGCLPKYGVSVNDVEVEDGSVQA